MSSASSLIAALRGTTAPFRTVRSRPGLRRNTVLAALRSCTVTLGLGQPGTSRDGLPRPLVFLVAAGLSALAVGVPTDVIDTSFFVRMTPVRWWEYPVLALTALLTALWAASPRPVSASPSPGGARVVGSTLLSALAIGCPICNKLVVAALGVSGALGIWAPLQPLVAIVSLILVAMAVTTRRRACVGRCAAPVCPTKPGGAT